MNYSVNAGSLSYHFKPDVPHVVQETFGKDLQDNTSCVLWKLMNN